MIDGFGLHAAIKTPGSTGLHIYLPLPPKTPNEAATLVPQMIPTKVADAHPREATTERFEKVGDIWNEAMGEKNSLRALV